MNIQLVRNATLVIQYGGKTILVDPFLAAQGTYPGFPLTVNQDKMNPLVGLPVPAEDITQPDAVIVTHLHLDHFDLVAMELLPKTTPIYAQSPQDADTIRNAGFSNVQTFEQPAQLGDISFFRTGGRHGTGKIGELMGMVSGVILNHENEKTLYIAGDTIWCDEVKEAIDAYHPAIIVVNGGAAQPLEGDPITMTKEDIYQVHLAAKESTVLVCHMEAVNHCLLTREELRGFLTERGCESQVLVQDDGDTLSF